MPGLQTQDDMTELVSSFTLTRCYHSVTVWKHDYVTRGVAFLPALPAGTHPERCIVHRSHCSTHPFVNIYSTWPKVCGHNTHILLLNSKFQNNIINMDLLTFDYGTWLQEIAFLRFGLQSGSSPSQQGLLQGLHRVLCKPCSSIPNLANYFFVDLMLSHWNSVSATKLEALYCLKYHFIYSINISLYWNLRPIYYTS